MNRHGGFLKKKGVHILYYNYLYVFVVLIMFQYLHIFKYPFYSSVYIIDIIHSILYSTS